MLMAMVALYVPATTPRIKNKAFEWFMYTHQLMTLPFMILLCAHATGCYFKFVKGNNNQCSTLNGYYYLLPGMMVYTCERVVRWWRSRAYRIVAVIRHPQDTYEIRFLSLQYKSSQLYAASQYVYLNFPGVARWQWHPFTLTSDPDTDSHMSVHIKVAGDFTRRLAE